MSKPYRAAASLHCENPSVPFVRPFRTPRTCCCLLLNDVEMKLESHDIYQVIIPKAKNKNMEPLGITIHEDEHMGPDLQQTFPMAQLSFGSRGKPKCAFISGINEGSIAQQLGLRMHDILVHWWCVWVHDRNRNDNVVQLLTNRSRQGDYSIGHLTENNSVIRCWLPISCKEFRGVKQISFQEERFVFYVARAKSTTPPLSPPPPPLSSSSSSLMVSLKDKEEVEELRRDIAQLTTDVDGIREEVLSSEMHHMLEEKYCRLAELEELERIENITKESGLTDESYGGNDDDDDGKCPICFLDVPFDNFHMNWCCGYQLCMQCREQTTAASRHCPNCRRSIDGREYSLQNIKRCAREEERTWAQLEWGLILVYGQNGVPQDRFHGVLWLEKAASAGSVKAMLTLSTLWKKGFMKEANIPRSEEKAVGYLLEAAKTGNKDIKRNVGEQLLSMGKCKDALTLFVLSAAQGNSYAQMRMGAINAHGACGVRRSIFATIYWFRKAALNGAIDAQFLLASALLEAKQSMLHVKSNVNVYSAHAEARFWLQMFTKDTTPADKAGAQFPFNGFVRCLCCGKLANFIRKDGRIGFLRCPNCIGFVYCSDCRSSDSYKEHEVDCKSWSGKFIEGQVKFVLRKLEMDQCSCCGKSKNDNGEDVNSRFTLQECEKCQAIAYCSKECQDKHWEMWHKIDCRTVAHWRNAMQARATTAEEN